MEENSKGPFSTPLQGTFLWKANEAEGGEGQQIVKCTFRSDSDDDSKLGLASDETVTVARAVPLVELLSYGPYAFLASLCLLAL